MKLACPKNIIELESNASPKFCDSFLRDGEKIIMERMERKVMGDRKLKEEKGTKRERKGSKIENSAQF